MSMPVATPTLRPSVHAEERFAALFPHLDILQAAQEGEPIEGALAMSLTGRPLSYWNKADQFILDPQRQGLLVINKGSIVTFLRLGIEAQRIVKGERSANQLPAPANPTFRDEDRKRASPLAERFAVEFSLVDPQHVPAQRVTTSDKRITDALRALPTLLPRRRRKDYLIYVLPDRSTIRVTQHQWTLYMVEWGPKLKEKTKLVVEGESKS